MKNKLTLTSALVLSATAAVFGQDQPAETKTEASAPNWIAKTFGEGVPSAIKNGKINLNSRLRYEWGDQQTLDPSHATTIRTRFGFTTAPVHGFKGMLEGEHVQQIGDLDNYGLPGGSQGPGKTVIADPEVIQLNQAWLSYDNWDTTLKGGRQRIVHDNARFVGDVVWRQNQQTYDAVSLVNKSIDDLTVNYSYVWEVNRIFGDNDNLPAGTRDFTSDSHLLNVSYTGLPYGKLTGYAYLLAFDNSAPNSTATFGASFTGSRKVADDSVNLGYWVEYAHQTEYRNQATAGFDADYFRVEGKGTTKGVTLGAGYELLGSDSGAKGFTTPLATAHAFNGWADAFLGTPATGLQDIYAFVGYTLPGKIPVKLVYHKFDSDFGGLDFGHEWDFLAVKSFGKHWKAVAKYAYLDGKGAIADRQRFSTEINFNF